MLLDLSKIVNVPGEIPFETEFDFTDLVFGSIAPAQEPVIARGTVRNSADVLRMEGTVETVLSCTCDRCAKEFRKPVSFPLTAILVRELENEDDEDEWTFLLEHDCADLTDIVRTTFILNMDTRFLCKEDCKGLCAVCGKDLNGGPCECQPEADPRLAVLKQLLKGN